jgi:lipoyl(octanoyl) transferase
VEILNWLSEGPVSYLEAWERQKERVALRAAGQVGDALILLEHKPVVSYGKASDPRFRLLDEAGYAARGIDLIPSDRGGDATYHGPGQLVGYPIVHLGEGSRDLHAYVRALEEVLIRTAADFGVAARRVDWHAGVWTEDDGYLAAIGVKVSRWVTHHGFALNVDARVREGFATIVPCGQSGRRVATLSEEAGRRISPGEAGERAGAHALDILGKIVHTASQTGREARQVAQ